LKEFTDGVVTIPSGSHVKWNTGVHLMLKCGRILSH